MFESVTPSMWRRIVRHAFEKTQGMDVVHQAIQLWQTQFGDAKNVQLHTRPFAQALAEQLAHPERKSELALLLIAALHSPAEHLPADPMPANPLPASAQGSSPNAFKPVIAEIAQVPAPVAAPVVAQPIHIQADVINYTLTALLTTLDQKLAQLNQADTLRIDFKMLLVNRSTRDAMALNRSAQEQWLYWVKAPNTEHLPFNLTQGQCTSLINIVYVFLAQNLGPVQADELLSSAVSAVEQTTVGRNYSPKHFL